MKYLVKKIILLIIVLSILTGCESIPIIRFDGSRQGPCLGVYGIVGGVDDESSK